MGGKWVMTILLSRPQGRDARESLSLSTSRSQILPSSGEAFSSWSEGSIQSLVPAMPVLPNTTEVFCRGITEGGRAFLTLLRLDHQ